MSHQKSCGKLIGTALVHLATLACLQVMLLVPAGAQIQSRLTGTVTDSTGGFVAGASVLATNAATGVKYTATTNETGIYVFPVLPVGSYDLLCEHSGFTTVHRSGIVLETGFTRTVDIMLAPGTVTESVDVRAETPLVEAESSTVGQLIERSAVMDMPLQSRRSGSLVRLMGNVAFSQESGYEQIPVFSMAGGRGRNQVWLLDGGIVQNIKHENATLSMNPPAEALQEFKIEANNFSAEAGRAGGGVIMMTTRSGTNAFHGALYEFFRNDKLDARTFFARSRAPLRYNIFGGSLGGPIVKNQTFFFFNYEGARRRDGSTVTYTVPHAPELTGDFSRRTDVAILDPTTGAPFSGNIIPGSRIDPVGQSFARLYPAPNITGNNETRAPANNFIVNVSDTLTQDFYTTRIDHNFTDNHRLSGRYSYVGAIPTTVGAFPNDFADSRARVVDNTQQNATISWVQTHSPNLLSEARFTYFRKAVSTQSLGMGTGKNGEFGLGGVNPDAFARVTPAGIAALGATTHQEITSPNVSIGIPYTLTWIKSRHNLRIGAQYVYSSFTSVRKNLTGGSFTFNDRATRNGLASLLLGWTTTAELVDAQPIVMRGDYYATYIQDDWKITPSLTLNLGLRWELDVPYWEEHNRQSGFAFNPINPVSGTPGVVTFAGRDGRSKYAHDFDKNDFAPRFGFAYRAPFELVLRGGYGIHYTPQYGFLATRLIHGFGGNQTFDSVDGGFTPVFHFRDGMPSPGQQELGPGFGAVPLGQTPRIAPDFLSQNHSTGYMQQWNFTVQRQLPREILIEAAYLANVGHKLSTTRQISMNMIPLVNGRGPERQDQLLRPFPQFGDVNLVAPPIGNSSYHGLNLKLEKRYSQGLNLLMNYTWSKFMDDSESTGEVGGIVGGFGDGYTHIELRHLDKALSGNDIRNRFIGSVVYDLPFGEGRRWTTSNGFLEALAGGWKLGVIAELRDGSPYGVIEQTNRSNTFSRSQRPNLLRDPELSSDRPRAEMIAQYFDTSAFQAPGDGIFGNAPRNVCCLPGRAELDVSVQKRFSLTERIGLSFRADAYNLPNRPHFGRPNLQRGHGAFGQISSTMGTARLLQFNVRLEF